MTNLWTVLYFTLGITLTGLMLVLFKRLFRDKLSARWHYLVWLVLAILGIVNACQGKAKELPIIGSIRIVK